MGKNVENEEVKGGREKDEHMEEITFENLMTFIPAFPISSVRESPRRASKERST